MDGVSAESPTGSTLDPRLRSLHDENQVYLQGLDYPGMSLVTAVLAGSNFLSWSRSVKIALGAKMKLGFIDGTCPKPNPGTIECDKWIRTDYMVRSWILNSLSKDIVEAFIYTNSAQELWSDLVERFGESNGPLLYSLQRQISAASQGNMSVAKYFTGLKRLWDELWCLMPVPQCTCGAATQCTCGAPKALADMTAMNQLMQFLMGLNDSFDHVRNQILVMEPLPSINKAYSMVLRIEKQREVQMVFGEGIDHNALLVNTEGGKKVTDGGGKHSKQKWNNGDKSALFCNYCKKNGHLNENCFKLTGVPDWYKELQNKQGKGNGKSYNANSVSDNASVTVDGNPLSDASVSAAAATPPLSELIKQELLKLVKNKALPDPLMVNLAHVSDFAGALPILTLSSLDDIDSDSWIIDTGASNHMCMDLSLLTKPIVPATYIPVYLPDGTQNRVHHIGNVLLPDGLVLTDTLHLPTFKFNLLSVNKLVTTSSVTFKFFPTHCILQDLKTDRIMAVGKVVGTLYILNKDSFKADTVAKYSLCTVANSIVNVHSVFVTDFPKSWPSLLPELVLNLRSASESNNYASINSILGTANSIFKKFRYQYKIDLKYCLDNFTAPLLEIFLRTASLIDLAVNAGSATPATLKPLFESQRICCRIFFSLNFQELPEFFKDHMREWMTEFRKCLTSNYPLLEASADGLGLVDDVRAAVCENLSLYMEKNEEEFQEYLNDFALAVWTLLGNASQSSGRDKLAITAIKFLTTVSTSVHHSLFAGDGVILQICQSIVIPNVWLRDDDEEVFEMNYVEFIRRDMEGSDLDTKRRIACELLKGIAANYKNQVTHAVTAQIQNLLGSYAANPAANWKDKDCAVYLVVSLASKKAGGTNVSTDIVNVQSFFTSVIVPELQNQEINGYPMLKAGVLKFFTVFRNDIPKPLALQLFPDLVRYLSAESNVVHSYAASCIEKLLLVKDDGGRARYTSADITPFMQALMNNLFTALRFPESEENQYIMKCIMRVLGVAEISSDVAGPCIAGLTSVLNEVCKNPKNPIFNHYLFESAAILIRRACERDISLVSAFESSLFPSIQLILANDVTEFWPYAFQLLAQLMELNRPPVPAIYIKICTLLLSPESWNRNSNVPALVRLLQAFLQKAPREINQEGRLSQVLGIFNKLVSSPSTDEQGFYVLNTVIESLDYSVITPYMVHIWNALFTRLQKKRTVKFLKYFLIFMSLFLVKHDSASLVDTMNSVQPNIFMMILEQFWIPNLKLITGHIEVKLTAVASTKLICESPSLLDSAAVRHWGKMLDSIVTLLSQPEENRVVEEEPEMPDIADTVSYTVSFVKLYNAGKKEEDPLKNINDPKEFLVTSLTKLAALSPGRYPQIISENLDPSNQAALLQLCSIYNRPIV